MSSSYREMNERISAAENDRRPTKITDTPARPCCCSHSRDEHTDTGEDCTSIGCACPGWLEGDGTSRDRTDEIRLMAVRKHAASRISRLTEENETLQEDIARALRIRTRALRHLAEDLAPGPDGQDYIDRERAIDAALDRAYEDETDGEPLPHRMTASRDTLIAEIVRLNAAVVEWADEASALRARTTPPPEFTAARPYESAVSSILAHLANLAALDPDDLALPLAMQLIVHSYGAPDDETP